MIHIYIDNNICRMEGDVPYTDSYVEFQTSLYISIHLDDGTWRNEACWFEQKGVYLSFSEWQGNEEILLQNGLYNYGEPMFYIRVCDKGAIPNAGLLESRINTAVNKYKNLLRKIH